MLSTVGGGILALIAAAFLLLFQGASEQEIARRISGLRQGAAVAQPRSSRFLPSCLRLMQRLGSAMRDRMLSARDAEALAKTLAAAGLEPSKAMPIFVGAKIACLFVLPALVYLGTGSPQLSDRQAGALTAVSLVVAMMLPNWVMALIRRPYQKALRRGIPDALDLMVVCAEAGLGLESAVERVAQEMKQSNRPVSVEFSLLMHEMRIYARPQDRARPIWPNARASPPSSVSPATIAQTLKYGTPLSQGLRTLAAEMRNERMIQFEERAGKLPALLVMPMMLFILPCLFIILMGQPASELMGCIRTTMRPTDRVMAWCALRRGRRQGSRQWPRDRHRTRGHPAVAATARIAGGGIENPQVDLEPLRRVSASCIGASVSSAWRVRPSSISDTARSFLVAASSGDVASTCR